MSLSPTIGKGLIMSLYPMIGEGLYMIDSPLSIRGVLGALLLACLLLNRHDEDKSLYGRLLMFQRHGMVGDSVLSFSWQVSNSNGPDTPIL